MERLLLVLTGALILITHVESENGSRLVNWSKSHLTEKAEGLATNEFDPLRFFWDNNRKKAGYKIVKDRPPIFTYTDYDQSSYESDDYSSEIEQSSSESDCSDEYYDTYEYRENRRKTKRKRKRKHTPRPRKKITTRLTTKMPTATTRRTQATVTMRPRTTRSRTRKTRRTKRPSKTTSLGTTTSPPTTSNRTTTATTPTTKKRRTRRTKRTRSTRKPRTTTQMTTRTSSATTKPTSASTPTTPTTKKRTRRTKRTRKPRTTTQMTTRRSSATTKPTSASTPTTPTTKKRTRRTKRTRKPRTTTQMTTRRSSATRTRTSATTPTTPTTKKRRTRRTKRTRSTKKPRTTAQMATRTSSATTKPASASTPTTPTTKKRTRRTKRTKSTRRPRTTTQMTTRRSTATRTRTSTTTPTTPTTRKRTRRTKSTTKTRSTTPNTSRTTTDTTPKTSTSRRTTTRTTTDTTPKTSTSRSTTTRTTTDTAPKTSTSRRTTTGTTTDTTPKTSTSRSTTTRTTTDTTSKTSTTRRSTTTQRSTTSRTTRMRTSTTNRPNAVVGVVDTSELPLEATRYYKERCPSTHVECKCPSSTIQSYDGTCNNLKHSGNGVADTIFKRVLIARYSDGKYEIAKSVVGNTTLPSVRSISVSVFGTNDYVGSTRTLLNPIYLMFLSQDIQEIATSKKEAGKNAQLCCDPKGRMLAEELLPDNCQPIPISETDNFFSTFGQTCLNYQRRKTASECLKGGVASQQINLRPSYLDLSVVYGSSENENKNLRAFEKGHMKTRLVPSGGRRRQSFLPTVENAEEVCGASNENSYCYLSANPKVNQIISLAALQTLFVRLHNGIADKLSSINSKWSDDELYNEARKITIALYHHFTYNEALPSLLGNKIMDRLGLSFKNMSHAYDEDVSAEAMSEFAAVISPVISSLLPSKIRLQNEGRFNQAELELLDGKNHNSVLEEQSTLESALRGLTGQPSQSFDRHFAKELIEGEIILDSMMKTGMDQIAVDIQVGRDLGISSYNDAREYCGMDRAVYFQGFDDVMSDQALRRLQAVYKSPEDVDLAVGILQENKVDGGMLGPTTSCILGEQFMRLRLADRFFANVAGFNHSFTEAQLNSILATRFSSVVCDATDQVESMQLDAFRPISKTNPLISCSELPALDFTPWLNSTLPQDKCNKIK